MRLWSIHPQYLDRQGLLALWREGLLAQSVILGLTKGYTRHPQLIRFENDISLINTYLQGVFEESVRRGYKFSSDKIGQITNKKIQVTNGQIAYEFSHLLKKLDARSPLQYVKIKSLEPSLIEQHPIFEVVPGSIESWEKNII